ncbi:MAG TPA: hypothetical protein VMM18_07140 [Gemmatimonadaceae bacterium]|nr:hypothetical protein [Gemmatimonadaceae bacterium]
MKLGDALAGALAGGIDGAGTGALSTPASPMRDRELPRHGDRSGTTIHGWPAIAFGLPFAGVGVVQAWFAASGGMQTSPGVPSWLIASVGAVFVLAGSSLIVHGIAGVRRRRTAGRLRAENAAEPWVWDHRWHAYGSRDDSMRSIARALWFTVFLAIFLIPFNWLSYFSAERPVPFQIVTAVFDMILVGMVVWVAYLLARRTKFGESVLRFRRFPFFIGDAVEVSLPRQGHLARFDELEATLRCVVERYEQRGSGKDRSAKVVCYEVWAERRASEPGDGRQSTSRELTWRFDVPAGLPPTALSERPPVYWELEVRAEMPGVDYAATFLVPVYARRQPGR